MVAYAACCRLYNSLQYINIFHNTMYKHSQNQSRKVVDSSFCGFRHGHLYISHISLKCFNTLSSMYGPISLPSPVPVVFGTAINDLNIHWTLFIACSLRVSECCFSSCTMLFSSGSITYPKEGQHVNQDVGLGLLLNSLHVMLCLHTAIPTPSSCVCLPLPFPHPFTFLKEVLCLLNLAHHNCSSMRPSMCEWRVCASWSVSL